MPRIAKQKKKQPEGGSVLLSRRLRRGACSSSDNNAVVAGSLAHQLPSSALPSPSLSSKAGRALIRSHHTLQKRLAQAVARGDEASARALQAEIDANGGLELYQRASINGQSAQRGGDSSKLLMEWLHEAAHKEKQQKQKGKLHLLEVGSLSPDNAVSRSPLFTVTRIDLRSQHPAIETQDFMQRPLPACEADRFDIISLSLVLNYVPDPGERGEMLLRTTQFLRRDGSAGDDDHPLLLLFPSLFLVLPAPCVTNSRYLDEVRLGKIMGSLGYTLVRQKLSAKLIYGLWRLDIDDPAAAAARKRTLWKKEEVNPGKSRNNFAVVLK